MRRILLPVLLFTLAGSPPSSGASAQITILDRGEFQVAVNGRGVGTETFSIRQVGTGSEARVIAAGQIRAALPDGANTMDMLMELTGAGWMPSAYQNKVGGEGAREIGFELRGARFESRVTSDIGEQVKEYRAAPGTRILERGAAHHFHFLAPPADPGPLSIPVIVPRDGFQAEAQVILAGTAELRIGGEVMPARHYRVRAGELRWEAWRDAEGRVLRVVERSTGYSAVRLTRPGS